MRKITQDSVNAFIAGQPFQRDNTSVVIYPGTVELKLHGHTIAFRDAVGTYVSDQGWQTSTTKERLNGLLRALSKPTIYQRAHKWYWKGGKEFPTNIYNEV